MEVKPVSESHRRVWEKPDGKEGEVLFEFSRILITLPGRAPFPNNMVCDVWAAG